MAIDGTFETRRQQCGAAVSEAAEHGDADDIEDEVEDQALFLGEAAWNLAQKMRDRYSLGLSHIDWNLTEHFAAGLEKRDVRLARSAEQGRILGRYAGSAGDRRREK